MTSEIEKQIYEEYKPENPERTKDLRIVSKFHCRPIKKLEYFLKSDLRLIGHPDLLWKRAKNRSYSKYIIWEIVYNLTNDSNTVVFVYGTQGTGKSTTVYSLAIKIQNLTLEILDIKSKIWLAWHLDEVPKIMRLTKEYDIIVVDENLVQGGEDSKAVVDKIKNIMKALRGTKVSMLFIGIDPVIYHKFSYFVLESLETNKQKFYNRLILRTSQLIPLCKVKINVSDYLNNKEFQDYYNSEKKDFMAEIKENEGFSFTKIDPRQFENHVNQVIEFLKIDLEGIPFYKWKMRLIKLGIRFSEIPGTRNYLEHIASRISYLVEVEKLRIENQDSKKSSSDPDLVKDYSEFINFLQKKLESELVDKKIFPNERLARRYILYYFSGKEISFNDVKEILGEDITDDGIRKYVLKLKKKCRMPVSKIFEIAVCEWLNEKIFHGLDKSSGHISYSSQN